METGGQPGAATGPVLGSSLPGRLEAMRGDRWGADVSRPLAAAHHGGIDLGIFAVAGAGTMATHVHDFHELLIPLPLRGGGTLGWRYANRRRRRVALLPGTVMIVPAGAAHGADWCGGGWFRLSVKIDPEWLIAFARETLGASGDVSLAPASTHDGATMDPSLAELAHRLTMVPAHSAEADLNLRRLVTGLLNRHGQGLADEQPGARSLGGERLAAACDRLVNEPTVAVEALARDAGLTVWAFIRGFKAATGLPPKRWGAQRRALRARLLIEAEPGLSLQAVAAQTGFGSVRQLQRACRNEFDRSPRALTSAS